MARDINQRLQQLRNRRDGSRALVTAVFTPDSILKSIPQMESWEMRGAGKVQPLSGFHQYVHNE